MSFDSKKSPKTSKSGFFNGVLSLLITTVVVLLIITLIYYAPTNSQETDSEEIKPVSETQIDSYTPYTWYASTAYCPPTTTANWTCGANCRANPSFKPLVSGGNNDSVPFWYVGYDSILDEVVVVHQGANFSKIYADVTNLTIPLTPLNSDLFPGVNSSVMCHYSFSQEHMKTAEYVLTAVQKVLSIHNTTSVTIVGHSLGAALALLDSVYLPLWLPPTTVFRTITYGLSRVGNQAFANYVDAHVHLTHINNKEDPIPTLPDMSLGYVHPAGEVHIEDSGEWNSCPGQDNPSIECTVGDVPDVGYGKPRDHIGPYNGIEMRCNN